MFKTNFNSIYNLGSIKFFIFFVICYAIGASSCERPYTTEIKENNTVHKIVDTTACCNEGDEICKDLLYKHENDIPIGH
jgi:hypothetical protein